jgi:hypothetical protein
MGTGIDVYLLTVWLHLGEEREKIDGVVVSYCASRPSAPVWVCSLAKRSG